MKDSWKWVASFVACVSAYLILDLADLMAMTRQILLLPVCFLMWVFSDVVDIDSFSALDTLDVDVPGTAVRTFAFAITLAFTAAPIYLYFRSRKKVYLVWVAIAIIWIIGSLCFYGFMLLGMTGMMD